MSNPEEKSMSTASSDSEDEVDSLINLGGDLTFLLDSLALEWETPMMFFLFLRRCCKEINISVSGELKKCLYFLVKSMRKHLLQRQDRYQTLWAVLLGCIRDDKSCMMSFSVEIQETLKNTLISLKVKSGTVNITAPCSGQANTDSLDGTTSTLCTIAPIQTKCAYMPFSMDCLLNAGSQIIHGSQIPQSTDSNGTISQTICTRNQEGCSYVTCPTTSGSSYVHIRVIPASIVRNLLIETHNYWKHAKKEYRFVVDAMPADPRTRHMMNLMATLEKEINADPNKTVSVKN